MRRFLLVAAVLATTPAFADPVDDYVACLVGRAAVALQEQDFPKDADKALDVAYGLCSQPEIPADIEVDGIEDYVHGAVVAIAESDLI